LTLALLAALLFFGRPILERFQLWPFGQGTGIPADFHWSMFRDAWRLIETSPWCGIGLGNFDPVFAISHVASAANSPLLHGESDWLWVWSELGWPGVALILLGIALVIWHVFPLKEGTNQRFRLAALIAALLFALHSLIEISAHRVGTAFAGVFLLALALHRPVRFHTNRAVPFISRILGLVLCLTGLTWVLATRYHWPLPGTLGADNLRAAAVVANHSRSYEEAIADLNRALVWAPLDWRLYYARALSKAGAGKAGAGAIDDFRRARFLQPNRDEAPLGDGNFLQNRQPALVPAPVFSSPSYSRHSNVAPRRLCQQRGPLARADAAGKNR
jgi:hypothetical protein